MFCFEKKINYKIFILLYFYLTLTDILFSQVLRKPHEVMNFQRIQLLENQWQNRLFTSEEILPLIEQELQAYFSQFRDERLLRETIISVPYDYYNFPLNKIHTFLYIRSREDIQKSNRIFSPYLYNTFLFKAKLHKDLNQSNKALESYFQSLNYAIPIIHLSDEVKNKDIISREINIKDLEQTLNQKEFIELLNYFEYLDFTFGNENFIKETIDSNFQTKINSFKELYVNFQKNLKEIQNLKQEYYKSQFMRNLNETTNLSRNFQQKWLEIHNNWNQLLDFYNEFLLEQRNLKKEYSNILYDMALIMKEIEIKQKERERLLNQSSYYRGTGNALGINKTQYRMFTGYKTLLELAHNLNPDDLNYIDLLSDEYFSIKDTTSGLKIEKEWFKKASKEDIRNPKHFFRIISYYLSTKNVSLAKEYIENFRVNLVEVPALQNYIFDKNKQELLLDPFDHFNYFYINFLIQYYLSYKINVDIPTELSNLLQKIDDKLKTNQDFNTNLKAYKLKSSVLNDLASYYRFNKNSNEEYKFLMEIKTIDDTLENMELNTSEEYKNLNQQSLNLKRELYYEEDTKKTQDLFELEKIRLPNLKKQLESINTLRNSLKIGNILERIAYLNFMNKNLDNAIFFYNSIISKKNVDDQTKYRAMENIKRIKTMQLTGRMALILLPDNFER